MDPTTLKQRAIQKTDDDATESKLSAIQKKYYNDEFISFFCKGVHKPRLPLINIGTYCRVQAIANVVERFLANKSDEKVQIVSLGAGSDTRPLHVLQHHQNVIYHEIDFAKKSAKKAEVIRKHFAHIVGLTDKTTGPEIHTETYHLWGIDLRELESSHFKLDSSLKTLVISECCLCYLVPQDSENVLKFFVDLVGSDNLAVVLYEPIGLDDEFGRVMAENLAQRHISLPTLEKYSTLLDQKRRLQDLPLSNVGCKSVLDVHDSWLDAEDRKRISGLEILDEVEEMNLLLSHYCVCWGGCLN